jgi:hypothetical protein
MKDVDAGDAACLGPRLSFRSSVFDRGSHGLCETCVGEISTFFGFCRPLQRNVNKK